MTMMFTMEQKIFLLRLIRDKKHILFAPMESNEVSCIMKRNGWDDILKTLRSRGIKYNKDSIYLRYTTWMNLKRSTITKLCRDQHRHPSERKPLSIKDRLVIDIMNCNSSFINQYDQTGEPLITTTFKERQLLPKLEPGDGNLKQLHDSHHYSAIDLSMKQQVMYNYAANDPDTNKSQAEHSRIENVESLTLPGQTNYPESATTEKCMPSITTLEAAPETKNHLSSQPTGQESNGTQNNVGQSIVYEQEKQKVQKQFETRNSICSQDTPFAQYGIGHNQEKDLDTNNFEQTNESFEPNNTDFGETNSELRSNSLSCDQEKQLSQDGFGQNDTRQLSKRALAKMSHIAWRMHTKDKFNLQRASLLHKRIRSVGPRTSSPMRSSTLNSTSPTTSLQSATPPPLRLGHFGETSSHHIPEGMPHLPSLPTYKPIAPRPPPARSSEHRPSTYTSYYAFPDQSHDRPPKLPPFPCETLKNLLERSPNEKYKENIEPMKGVQQSGTNFSTPPPSEIEIMDTTSTKNQISNAEKILPTPQTAFRTSVECSKSKNSPQRSTPERQHTACCDKIAAAKADYYRTLAHKAKLEILHMEMLLKLSPQYSTANGLLSYYYTPSDNRNL